MALSLNRDVFPQSRPISYGVYIGALKRIMRACAWIYLLYKSAMCNSFSIHKKKFLTFDALFTFDIGGEYKYTGTRNCCTQ